MDLTIPPRKKLPVKETRNVGSGLRSKEEAHYGGDGPQWAGVSMKIIVVVIMD